MWVLALGYVELKRGSYELEATREQRETRVTKSSKLAMNYGGEHEYNQ